MVRPAVMIGALMAAALAAPLAAQTTEEWQHRWFWGVKGGALGYSLPTTGQSFVGQLGGEWLITSRRTGLYLGYSTSGSTALDSFQLSGVTGLTPVAFDGYRRIQIGIVALVGDGGFQPYAGGGFALHTLSNARNTGTASATVDNALANSSSVGVAMVMGGLQLRMRRMALYGHYQGTPGVRDFLLSGPSHSFEFGLRYSLLPSREDDVLTRR